MNRADLVETADRVFIARWEAGGSMADSVAAVVDWVIAAESDRPRVSIDAFKDSIRADEQARLLMIEGWKTPEDHAQAIADAEVEIVARLRTRVRGIPTAADFGHELIRRSDVIAIIDEAIQ